MNYIFSCSLLMAFNQAGDCATFSKSNRGIPITSLMFTRQCEASIKAASALRHRMACRSSFICSGVTKSHLFRINILANSTCVGSPRKSRVTGGWIFLNCNIPTLRRLRTTGTCETIRSVIVRTSSGPAWSPRVERSSARYIGYVDGVRMRGGQYAFRRELFVC